MDAGGTFGKRLHYPSFKHNNSRSGRAEPEPRDRAWRNHNLISAPMSLALTLAAAPAFLVARPGCAVIRAHAPPLTTTMIAPLARRLALGLATVVPPAATAAATANPVGQGVVVGAAGAGLAGAWLIRRERRDAAARESAAEEKIEALRADLEVAKSVEAKAMAAVAEEMALREGKEERNRELMAEFETLKRRASEEGSLRRAAEAQAAEMRKYTPEWRDSVLEGERLLLSLLLLLGVAAVVTMACIRHRSARS